MPKIRMRLTYANIVSTLCLFLVLGGGAYAATQLKKNSVRSRQIKNGQVKAPDIGKNAVASRAVANGSLLQKDFKPNQLPGGFTKVTRRFGNAISIVPGATGSTTAACQPGESLTGGGSRAEDGIFTDYILDGSYPLIGDGADQTVEGTPDKWQVTYTNRDTNNNGMDSITVRAYVVCAA